MNLVKNNLLWSGFKYHHLEVIISKKNFGNFQSWFSLKCGSLFPDQNQFLLVCLEVFKNTQTLIWQVKILSRELSRDLNLIPNLYNCSFSGKNFLLICDMVEAFICFFTMTKRKI